MRTAKDLVGMKFKRLTVMSRTENNLRGDVQWICVCACGNKKTVISANLLNGSTGSCGCFVKKRGPNKTSRNGISISKTVEYKTWQGIIHRCENSNFHHFHNYGGRGITVCERWHSFNNFFADMGFRPAGCSIDRINNDKGYSPENCRWSTRKEQQRNMRTNRKVLFGESLLTIAEISEKTGIPGQTIIARLNRGLSVELAIRSGSKARNRQS